eukprot:249894-Chlamydomonas_euryale.AAC.3
MRGVDGGRGAACGQGAERGRVFGKAEGRKGGGLMGERGAACGKRAECRVFGKAEGRKGGERQEHPLGCLSVVFLPVGRSVCVSVLLPSFLAPACTAGNEQATPLRPAPVSLHTLART